MRGYTHPPLEIFYLSHLSSFGALRVWKKKRGRKRREVRRRVETRLDEERRRRTNVSISSVLSGGSEEDIHLFDGKPSSLGKPEAEGTSQDVDAGEEDEDLSIRETVDEIGSDLCKARWKARSSVLVSSSEGNRETDLLTRHGEVESPLS